MYVLVCFGEFPSVVIIDLLCINVLCMSNVLVYNESMVSVMDSDDYS